MAHGATWWQSQTNYVWVLGGGRESTILIPVPGERGWQDQATVGSSPERNMMACVSGGSHGAQAGLEEVAEGQRPGDGLGKVSKGPGVWFWEHNSTA